MIADDATARNAKNCMLMEAAKESVNKLSAPSLILFVMGTAEDADDISR